MAIDNISVNEPCLMLGDCVEKMREIPGGSIDLTVTSPPYDGLRLYNGYSFDFEAIAKELFRVTKPGGVVVWVVGDATVNGSETGTSFRQALYFKDVGFNLHDTMIYSKNTPPVAPSSRKYQPEFEYMFVLTKGAIGTFNPIMVEKVYADTRASNNYHRTADDKRVKAARSARTDKKKGNIWHYNVGGGHSTTDKIAFQHPAIFPEQLAADHITSWSNPGDTVLDPFMGSGTTGKMAALAGRKFIGIEISEDYCRIAEQRIMASQTILPIFDNPNSMQEEPCASEC